MDSIVSFFLKKIAQQFDSYIFFPAKPSKSFAQKEKTKKQIKNHKQTKNSKENFFPLDLNKYSQTKCTLNLFSETSAGISTGKF